MGRLGLGCLVAIVVVLVIGGIWYVGARNNFVTLDENVNQQWAQVQSQYQRRYDLIPNLVRTVQGAANFEKSTLEAVVNARARVGQVQIGNTPGGGAANVPNDPAAMQQFEQAQGGLSSALSRLLVVVERYPDLKSNQNFLELQSELEGTENRIAVERMRYNQAAQQFNTAIRRFPGNLVAGMSNFKAKTYFQVQNPAANQAPSVDFNNFGTNTAAPSTATH
jgi:LemA protein